MIMCHFPRLSTWTLLEIMPYSRLSWGFYALNMRGLFTGKMTRSHGNHRRPDPWLADTHILLEAPTLSIPNPPIKALSATNSNCKCGRKTFILKPITVYVILQNYGSLLLI
jgi:hypothetical protein